MTHKHLNIHNNFLKFFYLILLLVLIFSITYSSRNFKIDLKDISKQTKLTIDYYKYKYKFARSENKSAYEATLSIIFKKEVAAIESESPVTSIPVLVYHRIPPLPENDNVSIDKFEDQMFTLKKSGYTTINIEDLYTFMKEEKKLPEKSILITFDDGAKESYYPVDPILQTIGYNAVSFIISEHSINDNNNYYLNKNELHRMIKSKRWEVQSHTKDGHDLYKISQDGKKGHFYSNKLWLEESNRLETDNEYRKRIEKDLIEVKYDIEKELNNSVTSIAYPFGDYGQETINNPDAIEEVADVIQNNYTMSFIQVRSDTSFSQNYFNNTNPPYLIKRIEVKSDWSGEDLINAIQKGESKKLPYIDDFSNNNGWIKLWGNLENKENILSLKSLSNTTGSASYLDGTYAWKNYIFAAIVDWKKGSSISMVSRYKDNNNHVTCNFSDNYISIKQKLNGKVEKLEEKKVELPEDKNNLDIEMLVSDSSVFCLLQGQIVAKNDKIDSSLSNGGIGFQTWDKEKNNSIVEIKHVQVEKIEN